MSEEIEIAKLWFQKAKNDLLNAEKVPYDTVCFHCQQAAEKLLKAYLVVNKKTYPITHDLFFILENILPLNNTAEQLRDALAILMPYAVEIRYPDDFFMPNEQDAKEARAAVGEVLKWIENVMVEIFRDLQN